MLKKIYDFINSKFTWDFKKTIFGQVIHFYPTKIINVIAHILLGFIPALIFGLLINPLNGFSIGATVGITMTISQVYWENLWQYKGSEKYTDEEIKERQSGILMNVFDGLQYCIGAVIILLVF